MLPKCACLQELITILGRSNSSIEATLVLCCAYYSSRCACRIANISWLLFLSREAMPQGVKIISGATTGGKLPVHAPTLTLYLSHTPRRQLKESQTPWWLTRTHHKLCSSNTRFLLCACIHTESCDWELPRGKAVSLKYVCCSLCETEKEKKWVCPEVVLPATCLFYHLSQSNLKGKSVFSYRDM